MDRVILKSNEGMILTDGKIYGREIYLAEGEDGSHFYEIPYEEYEAMAEIPEVIDSDEASIEDYKEALARLGVSEE